MRRSEGYFWLQRFPYSVLLELYIHMHIQNRLGIRLRAAIIHSTSARGVPPIVRVGGTRYLFSSV